MNITNRVQVYLRLSQRTSSKKHKHKSNLKSQKVTTGQCNIGVGKI